MEETTTEKKPISYTEADLDNMGKPQYLQLREGWMRFVVTDCRDNIAPTGNYQVTIIASPLNEEQEVFRRARSTLKLQIPIKNADTEKFPDHEAPKNSWKCHMFATAIDKGFPRYPRKEGAVYKTFDGNIVDGAEVKQVRREIDKMVLTASMGWYNNPDELKDETFYGKIEHNVGKDGNTYANIEEARFTPPDNAIVITSDFVV
jgi:hypothetical protein